MSNQFIVRANNNGGSMFPVGINARTLLDAIRQARGLAGAFRYVRIDARSASGWTGQTKYSWFQGMAC